MTTSTSSSEDAPLHVVGLRVENFLKVRLVQLRPTEEGLQVISGMNGQGKSSVMTAIEVALRGGDAVPADPVRFGAESGEIELQLGAEGAAQVKVRRRFVGNNSYLEVRSADGSKVASPQKVLNGFLDAVAFDPLEFAFPAGAKTPEKRNAARLEMLMQSVRLPFDLEKHDASRREIYEQRTQTNAAHKRAEASAEELEAQMRASHDMAIVNTPLESEDQLAAEVIRASEIQNRVNMAKARCESLAREIDEIERRLADLRRQLDEQMKVAGTEVPNAAEQRQRLDEVRKRNEVRRAAAASSARLDERRKEVSRLADLSAKQSKQIEEMDKSREQALAGAVFPIKAITIGTDGVVKLRVGENLISFDNASTAQKLLASFAVMASRRPKLRLAIVRDGNALDAKGMQTLAAIAARHQYQVFVERVVADQDGCVVIHDGSVEGAQPAQEGGAA